jgi:4'-phosphopantetheinyl transferase
MQSLPRPWAPSSLNEGARLCANADVHLWLLALDGAVPAVEALLAPDEQQRASRFVFEADARRYRAAHGLLRRVLAHYLDAPAASLRFELGPAGKPHLAGAHAGSGLHFNLSHSGPHGLLGLARHAIGVDIEQARPMPDMHALARANFASVEVRALLALPAPLQQDGFFACWTRKEAVVKALGGGLSIPLADFDVSVDPRDAARLHALPGHAPTSAWTLWGERARPGVWTAVAVAVGQAEIHAFALC